MASSASASKTSSSSSSSRPATRGAATGKQYVLVEDRKTNIKNEPEELSHASQSSAITRREALIRQPSYCKILNELTGGDASMAKSQALSSTTSEGITVSSTGDMKAPVAAAATSAMQTITINGHHYQIVSPSAITAGQVEGLHTLASASSTHSSEGQTPRATTVASGAPVVQYAATSQNGQTLFIPGTVSSGNTAPAILPTPIVAGGGIGTSTNGNVSEEAARKREIRLMKNREAARECRNKKKEYIKCLENRVAVLENQNKALIEELKSLKELYTGQKS